MHQARRLYLHIGLQKTGTSYLQAALLTSRTGLAAQGLDLVPATKQESFELMLVVRNRHEARRDPSRDQGVLDRFSAQLAAARGSRAVYSQESLAAAGPAQVERLLEHCGDREVHVLVTVRDLARQLPSLWQEQLKHGGTTDLVPFLEQMQEMQAAGAVRQPWIHLDPPAVLRRWATGVPTDRIHVVTVPPPGSPPTLLLERFTRVLDLDPDRIEPDTGPGNSGLGVVQAEVLRRINAELPEVLRPRHVYGDVVKRSFSRGVLGEQEGRKILVPESLRPWCEQVSAGQVAELSRAGYRVEGDLEDLRCPDAAFVADHGPPDDAEVAAASVTALAAMLGARGRSAARRRADGADGTASRGVLARVRRRLRR